MAIKTASKEKAAIFLFCPHCEGEVVTESGSMLWTVSELLKKREVRVCDACDEKFYLPSKL